MKKFIIILMVLMMSACSKQVDDNSLVNKKAEAKNLIMQELSHYSNLEFDKVIYLEDAKVNELVKDSTFFSSKDKNNAYILDVKTRLTKSSDNNFYRFYLVGDGDNLKIVSRETLNPNYIDINDVAKISFKFNDKEKVINEKEYAKLLESYNHLELNRINVSDLAYKLEGKGELLISFKDQHNLRIGLFNENTILHDGVSYSIYDNEFMALVDKLCR